MDFLEFDEDISEISVESETTEDIPVITENKLTLKQQLTPFEKDEDPDKDTYDFLELENKKSKSVNISGSDRKLCPTCGAINTISNDYCFQCQQEMITFRKVELDRQPVKVVLKFPDTSDYIFCPVCGGSNKKESPYCKDCTSLLDG